MYHKTNWITPQGWTLNDIKMIPCEPDLNSIFSGMMKPSPSYTMPCFVPHVNGSKLISFHTHARLHSPQTRKHCNHAWRPWPSGAASLAHQPWPTKCRHMYNYNRVVFGERWVWNRKWRVGIKLVACMNCLATLQLQMLRVMSQTSLCQFRPY